MKYAHLTQIATFLKQFHKLVRIYRCDERILRLHFSKKAKEGELVVDFDLNSGEIYLSNSNLTKTFNAPFDLALKKRLDAAKIRDISVVKGERILRLDAEFLGSYKTLASTLFVEFTGRFTNAILTSQEGVILSALECYENASRCVKIGRDYTLPPPFEIREKAVEEIKNFEEFFASRREFVSQKRLNALKEAKTASLQRKIKALQQSLAELKSEEELSREAKKAAELGGILRANLWQLGKEARKFELDGVSFELSTSPQMALDEFFTRAKKLRQKASGIAQQRQNLDAKLLFLKRLYEAALASQNEAELYALLPKKTSHRREKNALSGVEVFHFGEAKICVGKNAAANEELLKQAKKDDWWFHLKDKPSAHLILRQPKQNLSEELVAFAAKLCAKFSGESGVVEVDYTRRRELKVRENAFVNYINFSTIKLEV